MKNDEMDECLFKKVRQLRSTLRYTKGENAPTSDQLKRVTLRVSNTSYKHTKMFGTEVQWKDGVPQDPCAGDSGGPLMYQSSDRWVLIGRLDLKCKKFKQDFHNKV